MTTFLTIHVFKKATFRRTQWFIPMLVRVTPLFTRFSHILHVLQSAMLVAVSSEYVMSVLLCYSSDSNQVSPKSLPLVDALFALNAPSS